MANTTKRLYFKEIATSAYEEENFFLFTTLSDAQIRRVIEPIILEERRIEMSTDDNIDLITNIELHKCLKKRYPKAIIHMYVNPHKIVI